MSDLICPKCGQSFDTGERLPRMFAGCGHSFCGLCVSSLVADAPEGEVACPEMDEECPVARVTAGVDSFPINRILLSHLNRSRLERMNSLPGAVRSLCKEHEKPRDIVCLTDAEPVCSDCALFGSHKAHEFLTSSDFQRKVADDLRVLEGLLELLKERPFSARHKTDLRNLRSEIQQKFNDFVCQVEAEFAKAAEELKRQKTEALKTLEKVFERFDEKCDEIGVRSDQNAAILKSLERQVEEARGFLDRGKLEESGLLSRFCPRSKLQETAEKLQRMIDAVAKTRDVEIFKRIEGVRVASAWERVAPKLENLVEILLESERKRSPTPHVRDSRNALELLESDLMNFSSSDKGLTDLLESPEKRPVARGRESVVLLPKPSESKLTRAATLQAQSDGLVKPIGESKQSLGLFARQNPFTKRLMENVTESPGASSIFAPKKGKTSRPMLDKSHGGSDMSLLDSEVSSQGSPKRKGSKSFLQDQKMEGMEGAVGDVPNDTLSVSQTGVQRRGSLLPKKRTGADNSYVATRDVSPFTARKQEVMGNILDTSQIRSQTSVSLFNQPPVSRASRSPLVEEMSRNSALKLNRFNRHAEMDGHEDRLNTSEIIVPKDSVLDRSRHTPKLSTVKNQTRNTHLPYSNNHPSNRSSNDALDLHRFKQASLANPRRMELAEELPGALQTRLTSRHDNQFNFTTERRPSHLDYSLSGMGPSDPQAIGPGRSLLDNDLRRGGIDTSETKARNALKSSSLANELAAEMIFSDRKINDASLQSIIPEVAKNKKAKILNLSNNFITEAGVETLVKKLAGHPSLDTIVLRGNFIEERVFDMLRLNARTLKRLNTFVLTDNKTLKDRTRIKLMVAELRKLGVKVEV